MGIEFTPQESSILYGLLAESTSDIIIKTDREGFIRHASPAIEQLGIKLPDLLVWPHILDLVGEPFAPLVGSAHEEAILGRKVGEWIEFSAITQDHRERWFALQIRSLSDDRGRIYGALSVMRCIEETRTLEEKLFAAELTDPLTGLTNRQAFMAMLQHLVDRQEGGSLALFDIDYFRAINMRHGQLAGDRILTAFADFLRNMTRSDDIISRIGGESFGILLPVARPDHAETICRRIISTLAELGHPAGPDRLPVTASAGVARIGPTLDATIKAAELAVFFAKARGGNGLEMAGRLWPA